MRSDMWKVIIERPRNGHHLPNRKSAMRLNQRDRNTMNLDDFDDMDFGPTHVLMSRSDRMNRFGHKDFSDLLGPLERFLRNRVGRHWNAVHSEISRTLDNRTMARGHHFWTHVYGLVTTHCVLGNDGKIYHPRYQTWEVTGFYVHPVDETLCYKNHNRYTPNTAAKFLHQLREFGFNQFYQSYQRQDQSWKNFRIINDRQVLERKHGCWFMHEFEMYRTSRTVSKRYTVETLPPGLYLTRSYQLGKRELKRYNQIIHSDPA